MSSATANPAPTGPLTNPADGPIGLGRLGSALIRHADWLLGVFVLAMMIVLVTPLPPLLLDLALAFNLAFSVLVLLVTLNVRNTAELSTFPTLLLFTTLFRLGLNVASTRLILSGGDAGAVITAFGNVVVGASLGVGLIVFLILVIIQFVVITKGAGRISEVAARFVLDAMPGKQLAIDADLSAGLIETEEARARRAAVASEAEFYGAMDGASKFVRGDAVAGLIITALNLVGGIAIGMLDSMSIGAAAQRYATLTVGDGLVSQVPALLVSTAAAVLTTRASGRQSLGQNLASQIGGRPKATAIAAGVVFLLAWLPGMPKAPFMLLSAALLWLWRSTRLAEGSKQMLERAGVGEPDSLSKPKSAPELSPEEKEAHEVEELLAVDRLGLEIGYRLIPLVSESGTGILDHIGQLRRRIAARDGLVLPSVRIKDNMRLESNAYRILAGGVEVARGAIEPGRYLAMEDGTARIAKGKPLQGKQTKDPAFGLPAIWVDEQNRNEAELRGYTVVDAISVLVTHLSEVLKQALPDVLSRDDVKQLIELAKDSAPAVVSELVPERLGYAEVQAVLKNLLREEVPIKNMPGILEALADGASKSKDPETLTELVRQRLSRALCERYGDDQGRLLAVTLDPEVEARLSATVNRRSDGDGDPVGPAYLHRLVEQIERRISEASKAGRRPVLLVRSGVRRFIAELLRASLPKLPVLSYNEVVLAKEVETAAIVRLEEAKV
jgi:flagellar biosynthesis protein FlhA